MESRRMQLQERRRKITTLLVRGVSPGEISEILGLPRDTVYNDMRVIRSGGNEELVAHSRREVLAQVLLNARERTRQLWLKPAKSQRSGTKDQKR